MLRGELADEPLAIVLERLGSERATGSLRMRRPIVGPTPTTALPEASSVTEEAAVFLRDGAVYGVTMPPPRPLLGVRLVSSGAVAPESLDEALQAQSEELSSWRLGELLVHLGYVEQAVIAAFVTEQIADGLTSLWGWRSGSWRFRAGERTRDAAASPIDFASATALVTERAAEAARLSLVVPSPSAIPALAASGSGSADVALDADAWALLCKIDGERAVQELALQCGFTNLEATRVTAALVGAGLVEVTSDAVPEIDLVASPSPWAQAMAAALAPAPGSQQCRGLEVRGGDGPSDGRLAEDAEQLPPARIPVGAHRHRAEPSAEQRLRHERLRSAAAAELAAAHAEAEAQRRAVHPESEAANDAVVVDLAAVRRRERPGGELEAHLEGADPPDPGLAGFEALTELSAGAPDPDAGLGEVAAPGRTLPSVESRPDDPWGSDTAAAETRNNDADTAALLRELSSLGSFDDDASGSTLSRPTARSTLSDPRRARRKGLFGRA